MRMHSIAGLTAVGVLLLTGCAPGVAAEGPEAPMSPMRKQTEEKVILEDGFEDGLDNWLVEDKGGHHKAEVEDGRLVITQQTNTPGIYVWCRKDLPGSFRLEYDFTPLERGANDKGFFLLFFCARGVDGRDILDPVHWEKSRLEDFRKYTKGNINCYHIGYLRGETGLCNLRKNPGLSLMQSNKVPQLQEGETYRITLTKRGPHITFDVKGPGIEEGRERFIDWTDPGGEKPAWGSGKLGFRQIGYTPGVKGAYDNVRIVNLTGETAGKEGEAAE